MFKAHSHIALHDLELVNEFEQPVLKTKTSSTSWNDGLRSEPMHKNFKIYPMISFAGHGLQGATTLLFPIPRRI